MKVLLRDDVAGVGRRGDIVKWPGVSPATSSSPTAGPSWPPRVSRAQAEAMRRGRDLREAQDRQAAEAQATMLAGAVLPISARAGWRRAALRVGRALPTWSEAVRAAEGRRARPQARAPATSPSRRSAASRCRSHLFADVVTVVTVEVSPRAEHRRRRCRRGGRTPAGRRWPDTACHQRSWSDRSSTVPGASSTVFPQRWRGFPTNQVQRPYGPQPGVRSG